MRYENLPHELTSLPQWVCCWNGSKVPMRAFERKAASSVVPESWCEFETAKQAVANGAYDQVGFVFNNNGIVGIDIDAGFDQDGFLSKLSADVMSHCRSYTEKSRSGRGIHVLIKGILPFRGRNNNTGVEIYQASRYFIMTGNVLVFKRIIENQEAIDYLLKTYFPEIQSRDCLDGCRIYSPVYPPPTNGVIPIRPSYPAILEGSRNNSMTSLAGQLHTMGYSKDIIYKELCYANDEACVPPLPDSDIRSIVASVIKYKRR